MLDLQPNDLAGTHSAAISKAQHNASLKACGNGQKVLGLSWADHLRNLLRLADVKYIRHKIRSPQRHMHQELHPGHGDVAGTDTHARLGEMYLETADVFRRGSVGRTLAKCCEPLAAPDVRRPVLGIEFRQLLTIDNDLLQPFAI